MNLATWDAPKVLVASAWKARENPGKSGVSSSFLPEKMNRHRAKKLGKGESLQP